VLHDRDVAVLERANRRPRDCRVARDELRVVGMRPTTGRVRSVAGRIEHPHDRGIPCSVAGEAPARASVNVASRSGSAGTWTGIRSGSWRPSLRPGISRCRCLRDVCQRQPSWNYACAAAVRFTRPREQGPRCAPHHTPRLCEPPRAPQTGSYTSR
jgi:hypothetical protein